MKKLSAFLILSSLLFACGANDKAAQQKPAPGVAVTVSADSAVTNSQAEILNSIHLYEHGGLHVSKAFLTDEAGNLIAKENTVKSGEAVYLNLQIKEGWMAENGAVSIGASHSIATNAGESVVQMADLFQNRTMPVEEAANLRLKTQVTKTRPDIAFFIISYSIWDKKGPGKAWGNYRLKVLPASTTLPVQ